MTIEERAIKIANECTGSFGYALHDDFVDACEKIATEQQEIDIQRAKKWLMEFLCDTDEESPILESLERAMKGE